LSNDIEKIIPLWYRETIPIPQVRQYNTLD
jgi:hypothetical protein